MKIKRHSDAVVRSFKLRLCHVSDTHGGFPRLPGRYDAVIHTGDFFPNSHHCFNNNRTQEMVFQDDWLKSQIPTMKQWLQGHPFLYVPGNHDFLHSDRMEHILRAEGIQAIGLTDKITTFQGVNFYGFPYVPYINGGWNYERELPEMQKEVAKMVEELNKTYVDVLACHAPPHRVLDLSLGNEILGSTAISDALNYKIARDMMPTTYLCGHIHEAHGLAHRYGMLISNAAVTRHIIEV